MEAAEATSDPGSEPLKRNLSLSNIQTQAKGTYALVARLAEERRITVGRLGCFLFPAGYYFYVGSALNGLRARIARHLRAEKCLHWHIDYLLQWAEVEEVWISTSGGRLECRWAKVIGQNEDARVVAPGFGASDCRCRTHLFYFEERPGAVLVTGDQLNVLGSSYR